MMQNNIGQNRCGGGPNITNPNRQHSRLVGLEAAPSTEAARIPGVAPLVIEKLFVIAVELGAAI